MHTLLRRGHFWLLSLASGASLLALNACDPTVRDTVLSGVGSAATSLAGTFIQAFFESLTADPNETATTVRALIEYAPRILA